MANPDTLGRVYAAIGVLRAKGLPRLDVGLVASSAGVARSTFYLDDDDWKEVRAVIKGKPSERVKLVEVEVEQKSAATQQIEALSARLADAENEVARIQATADKVYRELIDEVQRWFVKASEMPAKKNQMARYLQELNSTRKDVERLRSENRVLTAHIDASGVIRPLVKKRVIQLSAWEPQAKMFMSFLKQLDALVPQRDESKNVSTAYLMCGLPGSGKTRWIESHQPVVPGIHLYVDSCMHTTEIRRFIASRIRDTTNAEVHCVWLRGTERTRLEGVASNGGVVQARMKENEIQQVASTFEAPSFEEPFNSIILL